MYPSHPNGTFCENSDPCSAASACIDGVCKISSCYLECYRYRDADEDGHGNDSSFLCQESVPEGYVMIPGDCDDNDPLVYPGKSGFRCSPPPIGGTWDINCDLIIEREVTAFYCGFDEYDNCPGVSWQSSLIPNCGETGDYWWCDSQCRYDIEGSDRTQCCR